VTEPGPSDPPVVIEPGPPDPPARGGTRGGTAARAAVTSALRAVRPDGLTHRRVRPFVFRADSRPVLPGLAEPEVAGPLAPRPFVPVAQWLGADGAQFPPGSRIVAVTSADADGLGPDQAAVLTACAEPATVAAVAGTLGLRVDVVCVLVADLAARGYLVPAEE